MKHPQIQLDHAKCGMVRNGKSCGRPAGWGTDHVGIGRCRNHLGTTRNHRLAADKEKARRSAEQLGVPVRTDSFTALQDALDAANGMKLGVEQMLREAVAGEGDVKASTAIVFYADAIDRLAKVAKTYADANIDERRVRIDEELKKEVARLLDLSMKAAFATMAAQYAFFTAEVQAEMRRVFAAKFRELTPRLE